MSRLAVPVVLLLMISGLLIAAEQQAGKASIQIVKKDQASITTQEIEDKIRKTLKRRADLAFSDEPLLRVANTIASKFSINVQLDRRGLELAGADADARVTFNAKNISLQSALTLILNPMELSWMIRYESLIITSVDVTNESLTARAYDVTDLVVRPESPMVDDGIPVADEDLLEAIHVNIEPESWSEGNNWDIYPLKLRGRHIFVIRQTDQVHAKVEQFLASLRKFVRTEAGSRRASDATSAKAPNRVLVRVYPIVKRKDVPAAEIEELVREAIGQENWGKDGTSVRAIARTLVVKNRQAVHAQVRQLLSDLRILRYPWNYSEDQELSNDQAAP